MKNEQPRTEQPRAENRRKDSPTLQPRYAELSCKTNFSFLRGASAADELVGRAVELGLAALAVTDVNTMAGVVRAHAAAKAAGLKLIIGAEVVPQDAPPVLLWAADLAGYRNLSLLITHGRRAAPKGQCQLTFADVAAHAEHLLAGVVLPNNAALPAEPDPVLHQYAELFGDRAYLAFALHQGPADAAELELARGWARRLRRPLLAVNHVHYHVPTRRPLHDVLTAVRLGTTVAHLGTHRFANGQRHLKSAAELTELFAACPDAVERTAELADRCTFSLEELRYEYPEELCPPGLTPTQHLADLTWEGARQRYPAGIPPKVEEQLRRELALIAELRYEAFFLTVWDVVRFARGQGILCQGRGSAANSAVCFCLGITSVDPGRMDLLFERFISRERNEAPDIDVDFEHERREEVFRYIYGKYGRQRAAIVAEVICYRPRSAVRDVAKALGFSQDAIDKLARTIDVHSHDTGNLADRLREAGLDPAARAARQLVKLAGELQGFPRHLSQHVGGFVITGRPLGELVPIENAAMPERTVIQWDKDDIDTLGILKVDCLSLGMLTAIRKCFELIGRHEKKQLTLASVPADDPAVYDMIGQADTVGVFQIESRAQMGMLPRLRPRCFYDLVIEVAIVRPGPIQGGMVHPYLRRRNGEEPVEYPNPVVEQVLAKTLGVPLFQEQAMRLAVVAAGFTPGEADQLRRAMGAWGKRGVIEKFQEKLKAGMLARGYDQEFADRLYDQLRGFGDYGFPESHAASFALLAYVSAWLKCHHPAAFTAAVINSQPMGFYAPAQLVQDAAAHGVAILPVDVNHSDWDCTLERRKAAGPDRHRQPLALRLGFRLLGGFPQAAARAMVAARAAGPFRSLRELARRADLTPALLARLAAADAFGSLKLSRRQALWRALAVDPRPSLFADVEEEGEPPPLPELSLGETVIADYQTQGLSLTAHPLSLVRPELKRLNAVTAATAASLDDKEPVRVAGLVLVRQRPPTAKGTVFITLEDETGTVNLVIWKSVWERCRRVAGTAVALFVEGRIEKAQRVVHVMPTALRDLSQALAGLGSQSRNFR